MADISRFTYRELYEQFFGFADMDAAATVIAGVSLYDRKDGGAENYVDGDPITDVRPFSD